MAAAELIEELPCIFANENVQLSRCRLDTELIRTAELSCSCTSRAAIPVNVPEIRDSRVLLTASKQYRGVLAPRAMPWIARRLS